MRVLSEWTLQHLQRAGWSETRKVNLADYFERLELDNVPVVSVAVTFLQEFGDLRISVPSSVKGFEASFHFNAKVAYANAGPEGVIHACNVLKQDVMAIGEARRDHLTLYMGENGGTYGECFDIFVLIGRTTAELLERLCHDNELTQIDRDHSLTLSVPPEVFSLRTCFKTPFGCEV